MQLSTKDFAILIALRLDPFMPLSKLATKLNTSWITVKKRINHLKEKGIIRNPIAIYNPLKLGLYRIHVLVKVFSFNSLLQVEKACDEHPYTHYRCRIFGGDFGLFIQFDTPLMTIENIIAFFDILKAKNLIQNYHILESSGINLECYPDPSKYNMEKGLWDFSWQNWFNLLNMHPVKELKFPTFKSDLSKFKESHFNILRALTADASVKQTELRRKLNISRTELSRQYHYVVDNYISSMRLRYNKRLIDLNETYLILGHSVDVEIISKMVYTLTEHPPPFHFSFYVLKNNSLLIWCNLSSSHANDLIYSFWELVEKTEAYVLNTQDQGSLLYWFYPKNFNFEDTNWRISKEYMVKEPLERIAINL